jgi:hypothetical protein
MGPCKGDGPAEPDALPPATATPTPPALNTDPPALAGLPPKLASLCSALLSCVFNAVIYLVKISLDIILADKKEKPPDDSRILEFSLKPYTSSGLKTCIIFGTNMIPAVKYAIHNSKNTISNTRASPIAEVNTEIGTMMHTENTTLYIAHAMACDSLKVVATLRVLKAIILPNINKAALMDMSMAKYLTPSLSTEHWLYS